MPRSTKTERGKRRPGKPGRRQLPRGWRIIDGMRSSAAQVDPTIEQTRELAHMLFAAGLVCGTGYRRSPTEARQAWLEHALRRGDAPLCAMIERLDDDTFNVTWAELVRRLERHGVPAMIEWFQRRREGR